MHHLGVFKSLVTFKNIFLKVVGAAFADAALQIFNVCEFSDNDQFSNVEVSFLSERVKISIYI